LIFFQVFFSCKQQQQQQQQHHHHQTTMNNQNPPQQQQQQQPNSNTNNRPVIRAFSNGHGVQIRVSPGAPIHQNTHRTTPTRQVVSTTVWTPVRRSD